MTTEKKILFLDLDETVIHTESVNNKKDVTLTLMQMKVKIRPHTTEFLKHCSNSWNIVVYTASNRQYAEMMVDKIDPKALYIHNILSREHCLVYGMRFLKDFRMIVNSSIKVANILMLDNRLASFGFNIHNGMPMLPYTGTQDDDTELKYVLPVLDYLSQPSVSIQDYISGRYSFEELTRNNLIK